MISSKDCALIAAQAASDKKAGDIMAIDVAELLVVTDYFVICSANSAIQARAVADEVEERLRVEAAVKPIGIEGADEGKWILLDFGFFVVHVFQPAEREFYRLEKLWGGAPRVALPEEVTGPVERLDTGGPRDEIEALDDPAYQLEED